MISEWGRKKRLSGPPAYWYGFVGEVAAGRQGHEQFPSGEETGPGMSSFQPREFQPSGVCARDDTCVSHRAVHSQLIDQ